MSASEITEASIHRASRLKVKPKIYVILGAPGVGKGTQARRLSETFDLPQISTGDILRSMAKEDTPLGMELRVILSTGELVSDDVLARVVEERTSKPDCLNGYILDGFPRTLYQAQLLENIAKDLERRGLPYEATRLKVQLLSDKPPENCLFPDVVSQPGMLVDLLCNTFIDSLPKF